MTNSSISVKSLERQAPELLLSVISAYNLHKIWVLNNYEEKKISHYNKIVSVRSLWINKFEINKNALFSSLIVHFWTMFSSCQHKVCVCVGFRLYSFTGTQSRLKKEAHHFLCFHRYEALLRNLHVVTATNYYYLIERDK